MGANENSKLHPTNHAKTGDGKDQVETNPAPTKPSVFTIETLSDDGERVGPEKNGRYNPAHPDARRLGFSIDPTDTEPTVQQMELLHGLADYEHAIRELYLECKKPDPATFKSKFVELFGLSQLILEGHVKEKATADGKKEKDRGKTLPPDAAKKEIEALTQALIDDAAPIVKNRHLGDLAAAASRYIPILLAAFVGLRLLAPTDSANAFWKLLPVQSAPTGFAITLWDLLSIDAITASNFMLLWVGAFVGVCLSYAIRTHQFTLNDLTRTDADYFSPGNRLLLAGAFSTVLAYLAMVGLGDVMIGTASLKSLGSDAMVAVVAGVIFGIFEYKLTATVAARTGGLYPADTK